MSSIYIPTQAGSSDLSKYATISRLNSTLQSYAHTLTAGSNITVNNGAGTTTVAASTTPTLTSLTLTNGTGTTAVSGTSGGSAYSTSFVLPNTNGNSLDYLSSDGTGHTSWRAPPKSIAPASNPLLYGAILQSDTNGNTSWTSNPSLTTINLFSNGSTAPALLLSNTNGTTKILNSTSGVNYNSKFVLPNTNGNSLDYLSSDGAGNTSWRALPASVTPVYGTISTPITYTASSSIVAMQMSITLPVGTYRIQTEWNLSVTNTSGVAQDYSCFITDSSTPLDNTSGGVQWARQSAHIAAGDTQQMGFTGLSLTSTYSNQTVQVTLVFTGSGNCTLNANVNQITPGSAPPFPVAYMACSARQ